MARGPRGSTVTRAYAESPLKWLTPATRGEAAWVFASSYGGGLVGGDRLDVEIDVGAGAAAFLSTQASTKVYRSPAGASTRLAARVADGGLLVSLPDPVVVLRVVGLSPDAGVRHRPVGRPRRPRLDDVGTARHRASAGHSTPMRRRPRCASAIGLVLHDAVRLSATDGDLASRAGRVDVLAVVVVAGERLAAEAARLVAAISAMPVERRAAVILSAAPLPGWRSLLPAASCASPAPHVEDVRGALRRLLDFVPGLLGDDPWARKW